MSFNKAYKGMRCKFPFSQLACVIGLYIAAIGPANAAPQELLDIRFGVGDNDQTRVVLDLNNEVKYRVYTQEVGESKKVVVVEMAETDYVLRSQDQKIVTGDGIGLVGDYVFSNPQEGRARVLFELERVAIPSTVFMIKPKGRNKNYRLVIDLSSAAEQEFVSSLGKSFGALKAAMPETQMVSSVQSVPAEEANVRDDKRRLQAAIAALGSADEEQPRNIDNERQARLLDAAPIPRIKPEYWRPTIVIDAGHGGRDPGSIGQGGLKEKTVTLAAAKQLSVELEKRGYRVILTRDKDEYPANEDRIEIARSEVADLFLSIHADSIGNPSVRGASVYTLSRKGETRLTNQVRREGDFVFFGKDLAEYDENVSAMVLDVAAKNTRDVSSKFANILISQLERKVTLLNNTHREANLVVLLSPDVPAVLLELGFISNSSDEKNLNSKSWRAKAVTAVADSIDGYFAQAPSIQSAAITGGAR